MNGAPLVPVTYLFVLPIMYVAAKTSFFLTQDSLLLFTSTYLGYLLENLHNQLNVYLLEHSYTYDAPAASMHMLCLAEINDNLKQKRWEKAY